MFWTGRVNFTKRMTGQEQEHERKVNEQLVSLNSQVYAEKLRPQPDQARLSGLEAQLQRARLNSEPFRRICMPPIPSCGHSAAKRRR